MESTGTLWEATSRPPSYPTLQGDIDVDAAVVGGGIAGVMTAYLLKRAGLSVALLERARIGAGDTGHTTAHLTALLDEPYYRIRKMHGAEAAQQAWQASMEAIDRLETTAAELGIDCDFERVSAVKFAQAEKNVPDLRREEEELRRMGVPIESASPELDCAAAFRVGQQARLHPLEFIYGVAKAIHGDGSFVFQGTPALGRSSLGIKVPGGTVRAPRQIFCTHSPVDERIRIHTKLRPMMTYVVAMQYLGKLADELFYDNLDPYHYIRRHGEHLIIGGADHDTGSREKTGGGFAHLLEYARLYVGNMGPVTHAWSGQVFEPADGLPFIGERGAGHFFATGFSGNGMTWGAAAGAVLADQALGRDNPYGAIFDPARVGGFTELAVHNARVAWHFFADRRTGQGVEAVDSLEPGEGTVIRHEGRPVAVSKDAQGKARAVSATCTHLGCIVHWNQAAGTWDCACHGSRFEAGGDVKSGPARSALTPVDLEHESPARGEEQPGATGE